MKPNSVGVVYLNEVIAVSFYSPRIAFLAKQLQRLEIIERGCFDGVAFVGG